MTQFRKILLLLNDLKRKGLVKDYAIGGGVAAYRYIERPTKGLDVFIIFSLKKVLIDFSSIYAYLKSKGYSKWAGQWLLIEGYPTEFIPAKDLEAEAVSKSLSITYEGIKAKVMSPEYLIAISLKVGRIKDKNRVRLMLDEARIDKKLLMSILSKYNLMDKLHEIER